MALAIYPTTFDAQRRRADALARVTAAQVPSVQGLVRAQVLVSEDGKSIVTVTQWTDRDSFERYRHSELGRASVTIATKAHPKAFWLRIHGDSAGPAQ